MAVLQPGAYNGIYEMLKQRADQAQNAPPSPLAAAAGVVGKAAGAYAATKVGNSLESDQQKDLLTFKSKLEDQIQQNAEKYKAQGEGKVLLDQNTVNNHWLQATGDTTHAPNVGTGIWIKPGEEEELLKHAQFQTEAQKAAENYRASKNPKDQDRARFLDLVSKMSPEQLKNSTDEIMKVVVPETSVSKGGEAPTKSKDMFGRDIKVWPDGRTQVLNGGAPVPQGELVTNQKQLHPAEMDTFKKGLKEFDTKTIKDSKQTFTDLDKLEQTVKDNNPVSFFNNKVELVRLGGISAGRISQGEIVQEAGARDFVSKMQQKIQTLKQGDWTPQNKQLILNYIDSLKKIEGEHIKNSLEESTASTASSMPDPSRIDPEFIKKEFSKPIAQYLPKEATYVPVVGPKGETGKVKEGTALPKGWKFAAQ